MRRTTSASSEGGRRRANVNVVLAGILPSPVHRRAFRQSPAASPFSLLHLRTSELTHHYLLDHTMQELGPVSWGDKHTIRRIGLAVPSQPSCVHHRAKRLKYNKSPALYTCLGATEIKPKDHRSLVHTYPIRMSWRPPVFTLFSMGKLFTPCPKFLVHTLVTHLFVEPKSEDCVEKKRVHTLFTPSSHLLHTLFAACSQSINTGD